MTRPSRTMLGSSGVWTSTLCLDLETSWCLRSRSPRFPGLMGNLRLLRTSLCTACNRSARAAAAALSSNVELLCLQQSGGLRRLLWRLRSCSSSTGEVAARAVRSNSCHFFWSLTVPLHSVYASVADCSGGSAGQRGDPKR